MGLKEMNVVRKEGVGVFYAVSAFLLWGILPVYWKALGLVPAMEILAHRFIWSFFFVGILLLLHRQAKEALTVFQDRRLRLSLITGALLITVNWGVYIWAVNANHIIDASLGYYINPLVSVVLGIFFLGERLSPLQMVALGLAALGVLILGFEFGRFPWIALILAFSFGFYGLVKKRAHLEAKVGLAAETFVIFPFALLFLFINEGMNGWPLMEMPLYLFPLLLGAGIVTATPLLWFAQAANRVRLATIGFTQYLTPTINLLLGVYVYKESFTKGHLFSFSFIWAALLLYSLSSLPIFRGKVGGKIHKEEDFSITHKEDSLEEAPLHKS